jgi:hypothetical protein
MKIAYIILAHKNPVQLGRLVKALTYKNTAFLIHIDKKTDIVPFKKELAGLTDADIRLVKKEDGRWGGSGIVVGTIHALKEVAAAKFDYAILLSGLDYPLQSSVEIYNYFLRRRGLSFMEYFPVDEKLPKYWQERLSLYHFSMFGKSFSYPSSSRSIQRMSMDAALSLIFPLPRKFSLPITYYGGSQWWCLEKEAVQYVVDFVEQQPQYLKFHKYTKLIDEIFFQTILLNAPNEALRKSIVNDNLKFIEWSRPKPRPAVFTREDLGLLKNSGKLFARKFDMYRDSEILDMLDKEILRAVK